MPDDNPALLAGIENACHYGRKWLDIPVFLIELEKVRERLRPEPISPQHRLTLDSVIANNIKRAHEDLCSFLRTLIERDDPRIPVIVLAFLLSPTLTAEDQFRIDAPTIAQKLRMGEQSDANARRIQGSPAEPPYFEPLLHALESWIDDPLDQGTIIIQPGEIEAIRREVAAQQEQTLGDESRFLAAHSEFQPVKERLEQNGFLQKLRELGQWPPSETFHPASGPLVYLPKQPFLFQNTEVERRMMVVYVQDEQENIIKPRLIYTSTTHGSVKAMINFITTTDENGNEVLKMFDKADSEDSITLGIVYQQRLLPILYQAGNFPIQLSDDLLLFKGTIVRGGTLLESIEGKEEHTFYSDIQEATLLNTGLLRADGSSSASEYEGHLSGREDIAWKHPELIHLKDAHPDEVVDYDAYLQTKPNPSCFPVVLPKYGRCRVWTFESVHERYPTRYMVFEITEPGDFQGCIWIGAMEPARPDRDGQGSYLTPKKYYHVPVVTTPFLEKKVNFPRYNDPRVEHYQFEVSPGGEDYVMQPVLGQIPVIKALLAKIRKH